MTVSQRARPGDCADAGGRDMRQQKLEGPAAATPCFIGKCCNLSQFMSQIIDITSLKQGPEH